MQLDVLRGTCVSRCGVGHGVSVGGHLQLGISRNGVDALALLIPLVLKQLIVSNRRHCEALHDGVRSGCFQATDDVLQRSCTSQREHTNRVTVGTSGHSCHYLCRGIRPTISFWLQYKHCVPENRQEQDPAVAVRVYANQSKLRIIRNCLA